MQIRFEPHKKWFFSIPRQKAHKTALLKISKSKGGVFIQNLYKTTSTSFHHRKGEFTMELTSKLRLVLASPFKEEISNDTINKIMQNIPLEYFDNEPLFISSQTQELEGFNSITVDQVTPDAIYQASSQIEDQKPIFLLNLGYSQIDKEKIKDSIQAYMQTQPSVLITQNAKGATLDALVITTKNHLDTNGGVFTDLQNGFIQMLDKFESYKVANVQELQSILNNPNREKESYSVDEQLDLAIEFKDNIGEHYGVADLDDPELLRSQRDVPERVQKILQLPRGDKVLDVGCSAGVLTLMFGRDSSEVVGVDIVQSLIDDANSRREKEPQEIQDRVRFICGDIHDQNFPQNYFDSIYFTEFYEHLPHFAQNEFMEKVIGYLKPEGNVVVSVPNRFPKEEYVQDQRHRWDWHNHLTHYTEKSLERFMSTYFKEVEFHSLYDSDETNNGIWLVSSARIKK